MKLTITLVLSLAVLCAWAQEPVRVIKVEQMQEREGLAYEVGISDPFTGSIYDCQEKPNKKACQKYLEANYVNGQPEGVHNLWHSNGQKRWEVNYVNGQQDGVATGWHENGQMQIEVNYVKGQLDGGDTWWYPFAPARRP